MLRLATATLLLAFLVIAAACSNETTEVSDIQLVALGYHGGSPRILVAHLAVTDTDGDPLPAHPLELSGSDLKLEGPDGPSTLKVTTDADGLIEITIFVQSDLAVIHATAGDFQIDLPIPELSF